MCSSNLLDRTAHNHPRRKDHLRVSFKLPTPGSDLLRRVGVWRDKHIPSTYLRASIADRIELLRGLLDTDGCALPGQCAGFSNSNRRLTRDVAELVVSLGGKVTSGSGGFAENDNIQIYVTFNPFSLRRKVVRWAERPTTTPSRRTLVGVKSVTPVETVPTRCIAVDSPSSLFLAGRSMIPTHNSYVSAVLTCWWLDVHPQGEARVISTAPTSKQVDAVLWYEINKIHHRLKLHGRLNRNEWWSDTGRQLLAIGRKPPDHVEAAFQGMHARYLLVIYDEAYGIPRHLWDEGSSLASQEHEIGRAHV